MCQCRVVGGEEKKKTSWHFVRGGAFPSGVCASGLDQWDGAALDALYYRSDQAKR